jgi:leucyl-tRNA synthetase
MNNKEYILVAFPYPSSDAMHIGHVYNYGIVDSYCRYKRYIGNEVFQPFAYDSYGLPAENYAKKVGRDPREITYENIDKFRKQMSNMNTQYDEKFATSDPSYVKWTQWIFTKLKEHGLAYKKEGDVNWCVSCETTLANEQVKSGKCDRCGSEVIIKQVDQWYFKITDYTDRLIKNLDWIDYPKSTIEQQRHWLSNMRDWSVGRQRKWGCPIPIEGESDTLDTFVDSSFYFIRYCDPNNETELCSKEKYKQVDLYVIGSEHSCMHLIYSRFINMFLYDIGVVSEEEPFKKIVHQGMILNDGEKMSKTKGNVINPDSYDQSILRAYLMFIGHYFDGGSWSDKNISGIIRFKNRFDEWMSRDGEDDVDITKFKETIFNYTESFKFNKVISEFMVLVNKNRDKNINSDKKKEIIELLNIYMPIG